jgi:hypothetical protein
MNLPHVNYLAVLVSAIAMFILGGLWYSPVLFAKKWVALIGKTEEELKASASGPLPYVFVFICAFITSWVLALVLNHFLHHWSWLGGAEVGALCWLGFAGATSYGSAMFSGKPKALWLIDSGYNLVAFVIGGMILGCWR